MQNILKFHFRDLLFKVKPIQAKQVERSGRTVKTIKRLIKCRKKALLINLGGTTKEPFVLKKRMNWLFFDIYQNLKGGRKNARKD